MNFVKKLKKITKKILKTLFSLTRFWRTGLLFILILLAAFGYQFFLKSKEEASAGWWNESWMYRKSITVSNSSGGALTNFQVKILDNKDLSADITAGKIQSDLDDLRFTDINGTVLPYWIEDATTTSVDVWVKMANIPTTGATAYMYYGNTSATNAQNGNNVFEFFDDFNDGVIDTNKWTTYTNGGSVSETGGTLQIVGNNAWNTNGISSNNLINRASSGYSIYWKVKTSSASTNTMICYSPKALNYSDGICQYPASAAWYRWRDNASLNLNAPFVADTWYNTETKLKAGLGYTLYRNGTQLEDDSTFADNNHYISFQQHTTGVISYYDFVFLRKIASTDPSAGVPSAEEKSAGPVGYWSFDEGTGSTANDHIWEKTGTATNLVTNPSLETNTNAWTWWLNSGTGTAVRSTDTAKFGAYSLKSTMTVNGNFGHQAGMTTVSPSTTYTVSGWVNITAWGGSAFTFYMREYYPTGNTQCGTVLYTASGVTNGWVKFSGTCTTRADTTQLMVSYYLGDVGQVVYVDGIQIEQASAPTKYCDGSITGNGSHAWTGTAHASTSVCDVGTDGEISGAAWKAENECVSGKCLAFDGSGDYVGVPNQVIDENAGTVSFWAKINGLDNSVRIFATDHSSGGNYEIRTYSTASSNFYFYIGNGTDIYGVNVGSYNLSEWTHFSFTWEYDGSTNTILKGYKNGKYITQTSFAGKTKVPNISTQFGAWGGTNFFKGFIDEPKIYSYARTANQIKQDYNAGLAGVGTSKGVSASVGGGSPKWMTDGLVGHWKMDESSGNAIDSSGNNNTSTATGTTNVAGKFGNAKNFGGTSADRMVAADSVSLSAQQVTISEWVNITATTGNWQVLTWKGTDIELSMSNSLYFRFGITNSSSSRIICDVPGTTISLGQWYHVVLTYDGSNITGYLNGVKIGNSCVQTGNIIDSSNGLIMSDSSYPVNGKIDDVRIYNRALSPQEINDLYNYAPGPVGHWKMDDGSGTTTVDSSGGGNNGALTNMDAATDWVSGKYGKALDFDGTDDYVDIAEPINDNLDSRQITVSAWVKASSINHRSNIVNKQGSSSDRSYIVYTEDTNHPRFSISVDGSGASLMTAIATTPLTVGSWYYVTGTYDKNNVKIYVNGVLENSLASTGDIFNSSGGIEIGYVPVWATDYKFAGQIDDVRIYNYARTQKQIVEDMNAGHPAGGSPIGSQLAYWKFDEGYGTTANDQMGKHNGILQNSPSWTNDGKFGKAIIFDGVDDNVNVGIGTDYLPLQNFSICAWAKSPGLAPGMTTNGIFSLTYGLGFRLTSSGYFNTYMDDGSAFPSLEVAQNFHDNKFHHFCLTYDGVKRYMYVDGVQRNSGTATWLGTTRWPTNTVSIGHDNNNPPVYKFNGVIDEVKLYSYALTDDEIKLDYDQGKSLVLGSKGTESDGKTASFATSREYCPPGDVEGNCATGQNPAPLAEWKFENKTGNTIHDTSTTGKDGTMTNMEDSDWQTADQCKNGRCLDFDGTNDYLSATRFTLSAQMTLQSWVKTTSTDSATSYGGNAAQNVIGDTTSGVYLGFGVHGGKVRYNYYTSSWQSVTGNISVNDGAWHHIVATHNRTSGAIGIYVDGKLDVTGSIVSAVVGGVDCIGRGYAGDYFTGQLDDVKIYNYVRTPAQVAWDYNRGKPVGWWKIDEGEGATVHDESGSGNHGTMTNMDPATDWVTGKNNKALDFDGTDDYVTIPHSSSLVFGTNDFSISLWTYRTANGVQGGSYFRKGTLFFGIDTYDGNFDVYTATGKLASVTFSATIGVWEHHVFTVTQNSTPYIKHYINGVLNNSGYTGVGNLGAISSDAYDFRIGHSYAGGLNRYFNGQIDDVQVYNYALTAEQVKQVMNEGAVNFK